MNGNARELALAYANDVREEELDLLRTLCQIPAPSHHEERRARFVRDWLIRCGARGGRAWVEVDHAKNVICHINDDGVRPLVVFAAHTDVVFADTESLPLVEDLDHGVLRAPGIGDDTGNLCNLLVATKYILSHPVYTSMGLLVVANSCEEGLGNLDGTKELFKAYGSRVVAYRSFDGYYAQCTNVALGSHRFRVSCRATGGHSYVNFGNPSAVKALADVMEDLYKRDVPTDPKVTFNVGRFEGGTTVNSIPEQASMLYEYRSSSNSWLQRMRFALEATLDAHTRPGVCFSLDELGVRPGNGDVDPDGLAELTARSDEAIRNFLGVEPDHSPFSTDSNIPLSLGIPANTIGTVRGGSPHTYEEWIDIDSLVPGLALVLDLMLGYQS